MGAPALPAWQRETPSDDYKDLRNAPLRRGPEMTATSPSRPPLPPSIATKSSSTASLSQLGAVASSKTTSAPRTHTSSRAPLTARQDGPSQDHTSQRTTLSLIRRTLVSDGSQGTDLKESYLPLPARTRWTCSSMQLSPSSSKILSIRG